ncbi:MAG: M48 family metalloprotease [candidate division Zixibacteria bacterium]|nr:M48 family metalloprotease [candidate division Zixibacteria bacterium]
MKRFRTFIVISAALILACATTGPGGKKSFIVIPTSQEVSIGQGIADELAQTEKVLADTVWQNYLNEVGQNIAKISDRKDIEYHFTVIESDQVNAFALPGGFIYFYTGLLREMDNEAEMAMVLAHEISHVVARHGVKRLQAALGVATAYDLVFGGEGAGEALNLAINLGMMLIFSEYSRDNEREADYFGMHYLVKAGYDPHRGLGMFDKLSALGGGGEPNIFEKLSSTHPDTQERIQNTQRQIAEMGAIPANLKVGESKYQAMLQRLPSGSTPKGN